MSESNTLVPDGSADPPPRFARRRAWSCPYCVRVCPLSWFVGYGYLEKCAIGEGQGPRRLTWPTASPPNWPPKPTRNRFFQLLAASGSSWELLGVPGSVWEHLESVLAASRAAVPAHITAVPAHGTAGLAHKIATPGHKIIEIPQEEQ